MRIVMALLLMSITVGVSHADEGVEARFFDACLESKATDVDPEIACGCFYLISEKVMSTDELEYMTANLAKDSEAKKTISARPGFALEEFRKKAIPVALKAAKCIVEARKRFK